MNPPVLRPAAPVGFEGAACPPGCRVEPAGAWSGRAMEVVYDPRRHDVAFVRGAATEVVRAALVATGWRRQADDGDNQMWVGDRAMLVRRRFGRASAVGAPSIGASACGRGRRAA